MQQANSDRLTYAENEEIERVLAGYYERHHAKLDLGSALLQEFHRLHAPHLRTQAVEAHLKSQFDSQLDFDLNVSRPYVNPELVARDGRFEGFFPQGPEAPAGVQAPAVFQPTVARARTVQEMLGEMRGAK